MQPVCPVWLRRSTGTQEGNRTLGAQGSRTQEDKLQNKTGNSLLPSLVGPTGKEKVTFRYDSLEITIWTDIPLILFNNLLTFLNLMC